jgi:hypothetical protein
VDRLPLVQLEDTVAVVLLGDADVLVARLALVEGPAVVDRLHGSDRERDHDRQQRRDPSEPPAEPERRDHR